MYHQPELAARAASFAAGGALAAALLNVTSLKEVLAIVEETVDPSDTRNGIRLDKNSFQQGVLTGISAVKAIAVASQEREWPSQSNECELTEVEDAIMEGYYGA